MSESAPADRILVVRMGAMGDVIHTLPAAASLKASFPSSHLTWVVDPKWAVLLEANPYVDEIVTLNRKKWGSVSEAWRRLRERRFDVTVDFQGLIKSAIAARVGGGRIVGLAPGQARERAATLIYDVKCTPLCPHIVDRQLELARAAGATQTRLEFPLPPGKPEGDLPKEGFVLASPFAGWPSKEWPLENYAPLAQAIKRKLGLPLVLNAHPAAAEAIGHIKGVIPHISSVAGLIDATRRARAVIGVDSGPLHLAAALGKPGVAIFGPTDPARNGPYGGTISVLRTPGAVTSYKRRQSVEESMTRITVDAVMEALEAHAISQTLR